MNQTLHRKHKIVKHEPHKTEINSGIPEGIKQVLLH